MVKETPETGWDIYLASNSRQLVKIVIIIGIVYAAAHGVLFSLRFALATEFPVVVVQGTSMIPTYFEGDLILVKGVADSNDIQLQDVIVFHSPYNWDTLIIHRVVEKIDTSEGTVLRTKGDNNPVRDPWQLQDEYVVGLVLQQIPYMGGVITAIRSPLGASIVFSLLILVIVVDFFYSKKESSTTPL